jgi:inactive STAND
VDQCERLSEEIGQLKKKLDRCFEKRLLTDDPEKEIDLETLEERLDAQIKQKEKELSQLSDTPASKNRNALGLEKSLCNIDFDVAKEIVRNSANTLTEREGGSALFLIERCLNMEGHLLLKSIRDILKSNTSQFFEYRVEFVPTMPANKMAFLKILGGHLGLTFKEDFCDDSDYQLLVITEEIVEGISGLLRSGTTIFIPLANWQALSLDCQVPFLDWFMNTFWKTLVDAVSKVMVDYSPKVFFVIMVDNDMYEFCQKDEYFHDGEGLDSRKILNLSLTSWCQSDISLWLDNYSSKLKKPERDHLVNYLFDGKDEEIPLKIRVALEKAHANSFF